MTEPPNNPLDSQLPEGELDEYLKGDSSVSRQYRQLHSAQVPAELDRLVLRQAQDAVRTTPAKSRTWMRWSGPLALAASAVLVVSIVTETGMQDEVMLTAEKSSAPAGPQMEPAAPQMEAKRRQTAPVEHDMAAENSAAGSAASEAPRSPQAAPPPPSAPAQDAAADRAVAQFVSPPAVRLDMPAPVSAPAESPSSMQMKEESAQPPAEESDLALPKVARERRNAGAPPPVAAPRPEADAQEVVVSGNAITSRPVSAVIAPVPDPELWLEQIRQLRKENKQTEADREWRRFREAFPDHPVSDVDAARAPGDRR